MRRAESKMGVALGHEDSQLLISFGYGIQDGRRGSHLQILQIKYPP